MTTAYVRDDVRAFLTFLNAVPGPRVNEMEPPAARLQYVAMKDIADLPIGELGTIRDLVIPGPAGDIAARLFDPRERRDTGPAVVFFHGGGFVIGNIDSHASACAEMARVLDLPVISVDYRLAPEAPWPAAPDDCEAAARWVADSPEALGLTVTGLILAGDSAGGTLTIVAAMDLRDTPAAVPVIAQLALYPAADLNTDHPSYGEFSEGFVLTRPIMQWFEDQYAADHGHPRGSPMQGDLAGLPPAVVMTASLDPIRDQGRAYAAALIRAGVPVTFREAVGNVHGFITLRKAIPSSDADYAGALAALKALIAEHAPATTAAAAPAPAPALENAL